MRRITGWRFLIFIVMPLFLATLSAVNLAYDLQQQVAALSDLAGLPQDRPWFKVSAVLSFLVLVMTGIGSVCWTLVQQLVEDERKAQHNALHDHLTGLPNRQAVLNAMQALDERDLPYAVAFADLDGFKEVNDSYGHEFGDKLLTIVASGVQQLADQAALCARLGGDEFVILFEGTNAEKQAQVFSEHLISLLQQPFDLEGRLAAVGASVGIATRSKTLDVTEMLRRADIAMYRAKDQGRNRHCTYDETFDVERSETLRIANDLKSIITAGNLEVLFQPVVSASGHGITGVEALARWPHSHGQTIMADRFVTVAEKCGLIDGLGSLVLEKACVAAAAWPELRLAVNISALQLNNPAFVKTALDVLERYGIACNRVEFEITETSLIHDTGRAAQVFKALQQAGIKVALDDFGTGFSSIGYLRTFQFDRIKIDKSIVSKVLSSAAELAVVQGTLLVARGLSAEVTAEGVETSEQASVLRLAGCTELQGYFFYRPLTAEQVSTALRRFGAVATPRSVKVG